MTVCRVRARDRIKIKIVVRVWIKVSLRIRIIILKLWIWVKVRVSVRMTIVHRVCEGMVIIRVWEVVLYTRAIFRIRVRVCIYNRLQHKAMFCKPCRRVCVHHMHASEAMLKNRDGYGIYLVRAKESKKLNN